MQKDITACTGKVNNTQDCKLKESCKRYSVHKQTEQETLEEIRNLEFQKGAFQGLGAPYQSYQQITEEMYNNGDCMFLV